MDADVINKELKRPDLSSEDEDSSTSSDTVSDHSVDSSTSQTSTTTKKRKRKKHLKRVNSSDLEQESIKERWKPNDSNDSVKQESSYIPPCTNSSVLKPVTPVFGVPPFSIRCSISVYCFDDFNKLVMLFS